MPEIPKSLSSTSFVSFFLLNIYGFNLMKLFYFSITLFAACISFAMDGQVNRAPTNRRAFPVYSPLSPLYRKFYFAMYSEKLEEELSKGGYLVEYGEHKKLKKEVGRHPGFILRHPQTDNSIYFKTEVNADRQAFLLSLLSKFMSAPEVKLHPIDLTVSASLNGSRVNQVLGYAIESRDLTRTYSKGDVLKKKRFIPFNEFGLLASTINDEFQQDEQLLLSWTKFFLLTRIFNLGDFISGNSGIVTTTTSDGRIYNKMAMVDFEIQDAFQNRYSPIENLQLDYETNHLAKIIFKAPAVLSNQLMRQAMEEILHPKLRVIDEEDGFAKVRNGEKGEFLLTIRSVYDDFKHILNGEEFENYLRCLEQRCRKIMSLLE